jgi:thiamine biosynthesis lipoprotein
MSDYDPESELSRLSRSSPMTCGVRVSEDLWRVLTKSQALSERSEGAFDVTVGPLSKLWRRARRQRKRPSPERLEAARAAVGYRHLRLDPRRRAVQLVRPNMRLDLGGIAKGYAADEALAALRRMGLPRALINAGGDIAAGDPPPGRTMWKIGVAPLERDAAPSHHIGVANGAVATSGDAWQFVEINGARYSHIIDPRTGEGLTTLSSVTVVAPDCATADSLASAVSVLGPDEGLALVEETPCAAALFVAAAREGFRVHESRRLGRFLWRSQAAGAGASQP